MKIVMIQFDIIHAMIETTAYVPSSALKGARELDKSPRQHAQQAILASVFSDGLLSRKELKRRGNVYYPSADGKADYEEEEWVWGNVLSPKASILAIASMLYPGPNAICRVLAERKRGIQFPQTEGQASARIGTSVLVACPIRGDLQDSIVAESNDGYTNSYAFSSVLAGNISHVLVPSHLLEELDRSKFPLEVKVIAIKNTVRRYLYSEDRLAANVPDYETALWELAREINDGHWVHGVRLPIR